MLHGFTLFWSSLSSVSPSVDWVRDPGSVSSQGKELMKSHMHAKRTGKSN